MLFAGIIRRQIIGNEAGVNFDATQGIANFVRHPAQHLPQLRIALKQLAPHLVHGVTQIPQLVLGRSIHCLLEIATPDFPRCPYESLNGPGNGASQAQGDDDGQ